MSVDAGITGGAGEVLVLTVWNVEMGLWVAILFGKAKVNHVDLVAPFPNAHQEVVGLDIAVDKGLGMDVFDAGDQLVGQQKNRLQGKLAVAKVEEIFQARPKKIHDHGIVVTLGSIPTDEGNPYASSERLVDASFVFELRMLGLDALKLDGDFFTRDDVGA